jgi:hypothetical protein
MLSITQQTHAFQLVKLTDFKLWNFFLEFYGFSFRWIFRGILNSIGTQNSVVEVYTRTHADKHHVSCVAGATADTILTPLLCSTPSSSISGTGSEEAEEARMGQSRKVTDEKVDILLAGGLEAQLKRKGKIEAIVGDVSVKIRVPFESKEAFPNASPL